MSIKHNIASRMEEVQADPSGDTADRMSQEAFAALFAGVKSPEWELFMHNFVDDQNPDQLARLTFKDSTASDPMMMKNVVYLAATSMCTAATITKIPEYINIDTLDKTLGCPAPDVNASPQPDADADAGGSDA